MLLQLILDLFKHFSCILFGAFLGHLEVHELGTAEAANYRILRVLKLHVVYRRFQVSQEQKTVLQHQAVLRVINHHHVFFNNPLPQVPDLLLCLLLMSYGQECLELLHYKVKTPPGLQLLIHMQLCKGEIFVVLHQTSRPKHLRLQHTVSINEKSYSDTSLTG